MTKISCSPVLILSLSLMPFSQAEAFPYAFITGFKAATLNSPIIETEDHLDDDHDHHHGHDHAHGHGVERIVVQASRSGRIANDQPIRIELIDREEIEEKAVMRPGNISMLLAETGGVRVQTTSPALGSANIRLQGLYGRYTQLLADGLPLYGNQAASIGLLQVPPTDLGRVEIIKGSASSLYGGSALGGVVNLVSRRPGDIATGETTVNFTSEDGQDVTTYFESPLSRTIKGSVTAGAHYQTDQDIDHDGWIDLPGYERYTARPRLYWQGDNGQTLYATVGVMTEQREGGTAPGGLTADGNSFYQTQDSQRVDAGIVLEIPFSDAFTFGTRASAMEQQHDHVYGTVFEDDTHKSFLLENSISGYTDESDWVFGVAYQADHYSSAQFPGFDYSYEVPGVFSQLDYELNPMVIASVSARVEEHSEFGSQFSPRFSLLYRLDDLAIRGSYGEGYFAPTPFVDEIEAVGLSRLDDIQGLQEERAQTASLDFTYTFGQIESSLTLFGSNVRNAVGLEAVSVNPEGIPDRVRLVNAQGESKIRGSELLLRYFWRDFKFTANYLYLDSSEVSPDGLGKREIGLTPRHSAGFVTMWEEHGSFRVGFEAYYTGTQRLNDNPYMDRSKPYWHLGLMGEITRGRFSWFINLENLLDFKQTDYHPLLLPSRAPSGQWTTDIWSRTDGFIVNAGVRVRLGG